VTVVVSFVGVNGAVMASDSQLTTGGVKTLADKIWPAPKGILLGCASNNWAVKQHLETAIKGHLDAAHELDAADLTREDAKAHLEFAIQSALTTLYGTHAPMTVVPLHLITQLIALGHDADGYWLMEFGPQGVALEHHVRGFTAIGSGFDAAQIVALMLDNYEARERPFHHLKLLAHRMTSACIDGLAQSVGGPIQLWSSEDGGPFVKASDDELTQLDEAVKVWRGVERESLALSLGEAPDAAANLPAALEVEAVGPELPVALEAEVAEAVAEGAAGEEQPEGA
jgi:20S proteasome alpha/beta subunit